MSWRDTLNALRNLGKRDQKPPSKKDDGDAQSQQQAQEPRLPQQSPSPSDSQTISQVNFSGRPPRRPGQPATNAANTTSTRTPAVRPGSTTTNAVTLTQLALQNLEKYDEELKKELEVSQSMPKPEPIIEAPVQLSGMEGQVINGLYRIDKLMGQGGMGQIFLASHMAREEMPVVLKLLIKKADKDSVEYNRFLQEMLISGRLRHPNLIKVFDYGILLDGLKPYLVMEYVEGVALRQVLRKSGSLPIQDAARIITQACDGLHEVHQKGVVHRDLKPENLMVKGDYDAIDNVKILDFGIAQLQYQQKFDEEGLAVGSVGYMSPEQICAQPVDHRTDIYSLGLIFYEAITGHPPFVGSSRRETMAMHVQNKHMPPSAMASIPMGHAADVIVDRALAKHPDHRYQSVKQMQSDLYRLLNELGSARA